jgi:hypothetical protein
MGDEHLGQQRCEKVFILDDKDPSALGEHAAEDRG